MRWTESSTEPYTMSRSLFPFVFLLAFVLCGSCNKNRTGASREAVDSLNERSFAFRYRQIDSVADLAQQAYEQALQSEYTDGQAEALNNLMFERFQQMDFDSVMRLATRIEAMETNEVEQLVCDVMQMKVDQRTSDNRSFFIHRSHALQRLRSLQRKEGRMQPHARRRLDYARSDLHITASTYFYYVDQRERALDEIREAEPYSQLANDTAQWLYYCYMRGSGGLAESKEAEGVTREEFDYLMQCLTLARYKGYLFFEANSAQSLATMFADSLQRSFVDAYKPDVVHYLTGIFGTDSSAVNMARWALTPFQEYDDLYQTACALRTLGELAFSEGAYDEAIEYYTSALDCVNFHHDLYYAADLILENSTQNLLLPFDPANSNESVERRWMRQEGVRTVPEWIASIRQQLSVAYSALGMKQVSDYNRNIYLDLLDVTREDAELESRATELKAESLRLRKMLIAVGIVAAGVILLTVLLYRTWRKRGEDENRQLHRQFEQLLSENEQVNANLAEEQEQLQELQQATEQRIQRNKRLNVEKRAKLSLVHGIVPFLDRILHEVRKMMRNGEPNEQSLSYIRELIQPITEYNELLTEWIQVEQGQLSLQLTSFELEPLFASVRKSHFAYEQKGLTLNVETTDLSVKADRALTLFMLNTLADNARKFTPAGGIVTISATAGENEDGRYVELSVQDTGCGLTEQDVELILKNKVYDAAVIGSSSSGTDEFQQWNSRVPAVELRNSTSGTQPDGQKGFGFGLMNCKGIIEKYRKTNPLFRVCQLGIESRVGEGSRFFFRLPRVVLTVLLAVMTLIPLESKAENRTPEIAYALMDSVYYSNIEGRYVDALQFGAQVVEAFNSIGLPEQMEMRPTTDVVAETAWWQRQEEVDYKLLLAFRNEMAVAALALNDWTLYRKNNSVYKRLYKLVGQDATLESYCQQTELTHKNERLALMAFVLLLVIGLVVVYLFWFRPLMERRRANVELSEQQLEELRAEHEAEHQRTQEDIELAEDEHRRRLYEESRLHVQNQIIDNCLSTIKHETMYYPGRILQLAERQPVDLATLNETASYYKEIFSLLSAQADSQSAAVGFRRCRQTFAALVENFASRVAAKARRRGLNLQLAVDDQTQDALITADPDLICLLLDELLEYELGSITTTEQAQTLTLRGSVDERFVRIALNNPAVSLTADQLHNFFMPHRGGIPLLVVKQIIREHDTFMGHPGCRVMAEATADGGHTVWFTLPLSQKSTTPTI